MHFRKFFITAVQSLAREARCKPDTGDRVVQARAFAACLGRRDRRIDRTDRQGLFRRAIR
jgi:hypothetical protein